MNLQENLERIFKYSNQGEQEKIIEFINRLSEEEKVFPVMCQLACAYNNVNQPQMAIDTLQLVQEEGEESPIWNYFYGYACCTLEQMDDARGYFFRARELNSNIPIGELLLYCTDVPMDTKKETVLKFVRDTLPVHCVISGERIEIPEWRAFLEINLNFQNDRQVIASYIFWSDIWDREVFEISAALGNTQEQALFEAQKGFINGIFQTIKKCMAKQNDGTLEASFQNCSYQWDLYMGDLVEMGIRSEESPSFYWNMIEPLIKKRLGRQDIYYIKVYLSKSNDYCIAECRINNIVCDEISQLLQSYAGQWEASSFRSQKLFFILEQKEETRTLYPYTRTEVMDKVREAVLLFQSLASADDDWYENYPDKLNEITGDCVLSVSMHRFLPELCCFHALPDLKMTDSITFIKDGRKEEYYISQFKEWDYIYYAFHRLLANGEISDAAYRIMIGCSATLNGCQEALENNKSLEGTKVSMLFQVDDRYEIR